jgi:hypothetical protein
MRLRANDYRFISPRAQEAAGKYGVNSVTIVAYKPL